MSFIDDMKIGRKLIGVIIVVIIGFAIFGMISYSSLGTALQSNKDIGEGKDLVADILPPPEYIIESDLNAFQMIDAVDKKADQATIDKLISQGTQLKADYEDRHLYWVNNLPEGELKTALTVTSYNSAEKFYTIRDSQLIPAIRAGDSTKAKTIIRTLMQPEYEAHRAAIDNSVQLANTHNKQTETNATSAVSTATLLLMLTGIAAIVIIASFTLFISRSITKPLEDVSNNFRRLSKGIVSTRLNMARKDEIGDLARVMDSYATGLQKFVVGSMKKIAEGDLSVTCRVQDEKDEVSPALNTINSSLKSLVNEANMLSKAAVAGQLSIRGNADKFKGGYWEIIAGVNKTLDSVVAPVNEAMRVSDEYAEGNFTARFNEKLNVQGDFVKFKQALDNIGIEVSKSLLAINQQVGNLAASAEEANASVEEVSAGSAQVAKNASGVSNNAEKATQGIEQVQKAMEDLSRTIQDVATKSEAVAKIVQDTTDFSREGMELAQKTEQGMQGITKSSNDVNQIIGEIKDQMDKISEIVNLITDLANQTNLLALNAAIEAARAGDAGRGFAVVATEVKSLAVESRASAERISEMIDNLQKQTLNAVDAVTASNNGVREGSEALHETLTSFSKIVSSIDKISQNVSDVAAAAEEQAASVEEVTASVNEVGGLMQNTTREATDAAAASEESSAAIDQITKVVANVNTIVDMVTKEVSRFKV